ncbi:hypothetical protein JKP88DRAFT_261254 [Tribonema minus]|uniref:UvrD-like helicase ATP-binding domain-containing protein n=1 Tax=Tribonema minus TaxID=303371 RepID=A0A835YRE3_9STRA|nr:hypothetical protein JKP88DRAFT_261254 [Tribonema minus]
MPLLAHRRALLWETAPTDAAPGFELPPAPPLASAAALAASVRAVFGTRLRRDAVYEWVDEAEASAGTDAGTGGPENSFAAALRVLAAPLRLSDRDGWALLALAMVACAPRLRAALCCAAARPLLPPSSVRTSKLLYLCFNVSVREAAAASFPANVACKSMYQLARAVTAARYPRIAQRLQAYDVADALGVPMVQAGAAVAALERWFCSADPEVGPQNCVLNVVRAPPASAGENDGENDGESDGENAGDSDGDSDGNSALEAALESSCQEVVQLAQVVRQQMRDGPSQGQGGAANGARDGGSAPKELLMTHAGYLKLYQLSRPDFKSKFDYVMLDEAQDSSPCMLDIVMQQRGCAVICVGDHHQAIYGQSTKWFCVAVGPCATPPSLTMDAQRLPPLLQLLRGREERDRVCACLDAQSWDALVHVEIWFDLNQLHEEECCELNQLYEAEERADAWQMFLTMALGSTQDSVRALLGGVDPDDQLEHVALFDDLLDRKDLLELRQLPLEGGFEVLSVAAEEGLLGLALTAAPDEHDVYFLDAAPNKRAKAAVYNAVLKVTTAELHEEAFKTRLGSKRGKAASDASRIAKADKDDAVAVAAAVAAVAKTTEERRANGKHYIMPHRFGLLFDGWIMARCLCNIYRGLQGGRTRGFQSTGCNYEGLDVFDCARLGGLGVQHLTWSGFSSMDAVAFL